MSIHDPDYEATLSDGRSYQLRKRGYGWLLTEVEKPPHEPTYEISSFSILDTTLDWMWRCAHSDDPAVGLPQYRAQHSRTYDKVQHLIMLLEGVAEILPEVQNNRVYSPAQVLEILKNTVKED